MKPSRRFFGQMSLGACTSLAGSSLAWSPNGRIRLGIVGVRGRGWSLARTLAGMHSDNVEVAAFCDVDEQVLRQRASEWDRLTGRPVSTAGDMRRLIDDSSIDALIHATPTHWHALGAYWTMRAGKDAYIEKPLGLTLSEGRFIVASAAKYGRIVQHGTQCRSSPEILEAVDQIRRGVIGEVKVARGMGHKYRPGIGPIQPADPPASLNFDLWRGPAPRKPYSANQVHYNWHWFWDTGNGDLGNLGVHGLDVMRMAIGLDEFPDQITSTGGNYMFADAKETPNYQASTFLYRQKGVMLEYSIRNGYSNSEAGMGESIPFTLGDKRDSHGLILYGTEGFMVVPDYISYYTFRGRDRTPGPSRKGSGPPDANGPHLANFLAAMRSRKPQDLHCGADQGSRSAALCHYANVAYRAGGTLHVDPATGAIQNNTAAVQLESRPYRPPYHLPAQP